MSVDAIIAEALAMFPDANYVCLECGDSYSAMPHGGYCDNSMACTGADLFDVVNDVIIENN